MSLLMMIGDAVGSGPTPLAWSPGTPGVFESANSTYISVCVLSSTQALVCYRDAGNSNYGTYCILDISGSTVTPGTPGVFESAATSWVSVCSLSSSQAIVCYKDEGNGGKGTYCILDISGSTVTPGTPGVYRNGSNCHFNSVCKLSASQALVCYWGESSYGESCILDISGSTVTPGTPALFESAVVGQISVCALSSSQALVCYQDVDNSNYGTYCILDVSGSTITPGTPGVFASSATQTYWLSVCAISSSQALVCYVDNGNSNYGTYCILGISGSTVTPGTPGVFESASTGYCAVTVLSSTQAIVCYCDVGNSSYGNYCILEISGATITPGTPAVFDSSLSVSQSVALLNSSQAIECHRGATSNYGAYCLFTAS